MEFIGKDINEAMCTMQWAAHNGFLNIIKVLIAHFDITLEIIRADRLSIITIAAYQGHYEIIEYLHTLFGLTTEDIRYNNNFALRYASENTHTRTVEYLLSTFDLNEDDINQAIDNEELRAHLLQQAAPMGNATKSASK